MAMFATYITMDGEILSQIVDGVTRDYLTDPQGSVVGLIDGNQTVVARREYWPYGETRTESGDWTDVRFGYAGSWGYYDEGSNRSYVRFRYLNREAGAWQTADLLWPDTSPYGYSRPTVLVDPSGLVPCFDNRNAHQLSIQSGLTDCIVKPKKNCSDYLNIKGAAKEQAKKLGDCLGKATSRKDINDCLDTFGKGLDDASWDALVHYLGCMGANGAARRTDMPGMPTGADPCDSLYSDPPDSQWCCYENYLVCILKCSGKKGKGLAQCVENCKSGKKGLENCGLENAL